MKKRILSLVLVLAITISIFSIGLTTNAASALWGDALINNPMIKLCAEIRDVNFIYKEVGEFINIINNSLILKMRCRVIKQLMITSLYISHTRRTDTDNRPVVRKIF